MEHSNAWRGLMPMRIASIFFCAVAVVIGLAAVHAAPPQIPEGFIAEHQGARPGGRIVIAGAFDWLFGGSQPGEPPRPVPERQPPGSGDGDGHRPKRREPQSAGGTYRTLCV